MSSKPLAGLTAAGKVPPFPGDSKMGKHPFKRPQMPKTRERLESALESHDRIQALSDAIREREGLPPVPENGIVTAWRQMLAALPEKKAKRKAVPKRQEALTPAAQVRELAKRRRDLEREREAVDAETRRLVELAQSERSLSVSGIADALGLSRQRLYQLAGS